MKALRGLLSHDLLKRSGSFAFSVLVSTVVGLISIPFLMATVGPAEWGRLYILQVVGQFASILVAYGWGATGPSMVSSLEPSLRRQFLWDSLAVRISLFVVVAPLAIVLAVLLGSDPLSATLAVVTYTLPGVGAAWFFVGTNRPVAMFLFDALPAILGQIVGLVAVGLRPSLDSFLWSMAICTTAGIVAGLVWALSRRDGRTLTRPIPRELRTLMHRQSAGLTTVLFGNISTMVPALLVQIFSPSGVPLFGMTDKFYRYGIVALAPILQAVQSWLPEGEAAGIPRRARTSLKLGLGVGLLGGTAICVLGVPASALLTGGEATIPWAVAVISGIGFAAECVSQIVGLAGLVALGRERVLARTSILAAVIGLPLMIPATLWWGVPGAVAIISASALLVAAVRTAVLLGASRVAAE